MTVSTQTFRWSYTATAAASTLYPYDNKILDEGDLTVYVDDVLQAISTDYEVSGVGLDAGGNVTFVAAPAEGAGILITKDGIEFTQGTDYVENDSFPAEAHEDALDKLTGIAQKIWDYTRRSVKLAITSEFTDMTLPEPDSGKYIGWDGAVLANLSLIPGGGISDTAYSSTTWDGVDTIAPSKNAVRDKFEAVGVTFTEVQTAMAALKSSFSGAEAPSNPIAGMWWFDTTANILKLRNEANNAWLSIWDFANNKPLVTNNVSADFGAALKDPAVGTAGLRTLGTGATAALAGNADLNGTAHTGDVTGTTALTIGAAKITQSKLKTTTHEQSTAGADWTGKTLTYADYGFSCRIKRVGGSAVYFKRSDEANPTYFSSTSYVGEWVWLKALGNTAYVIYRYVTSSGEVFWVWLLRDKETGEITDADCCSDHCGWGLDDPNDRPHPFTNYDPEKHEILLFNPTAAELTEILAKKTKKRSVLQIVLEDYEPEETTKRAWPSIPVTFDIEDDNWEETLFTGKEVSIKQAVIKKVPYVKTVGMKARRK